MNSFNQQDFSNYTVLDSQPIGGAGVIAKKFMANVFLWMFIALAVSTGMAILYGTNADLISDLYVNTAQGIRYNTLGWIVALAPFGFVMLMSFGYARLSSSMLTLLFLVFAAIMGMSLSCILWIYTPNSIISCFGAAAAMFGVMAYMGYTTEKDLTSFGSLMMMGLVGVIISMFINIFLHSAMLGYLIGIVGVAVFTGLTAYDVQKLKQIGAGIEVQGVSVTDTKKRAIMGALNLYLDFINLFMMLLRVFGSRRD